MLNAKQGAATSCWVPAAGLTIRRCTTRATISTTTSCRSARPTGRRWQNSCCRGRGWHGAAPLWQLPRRRTRHGEVLPSPRPHAGTGWPCPPRRQKTRAASLPRRGQPPRPPPLSSCAAAAAAWRCSVTSSPARAPCPFQRASAHAPPRSAAPPRHRAAWTRCRPRRVAHHRAVFGEERGIDGKPSAAAIAAFVSGAGQQHLRPAGAHDLADAGAEQQRGGGHGAKVHQFPPHARLDVGHRFRHARRGPVSKRRAHGRGRTHRPAIRLAAGCATRSAAPLCRRAGEVAWIFATRPAPAPPRRRRAGARYGRCRSAPAAPPPRLHRRRHRRHRRFQIIGLAGQQHGIEAGLGFLQHDGGAGDVAIGAAHADPPSRSRAAVAGRQRKATSCPASAARPPKIRPSAPAPTTRIRILPAQRRPAAPASPGRAQAPTPTQRRGFALARRRRLWQARGTNAADDPRPRPHPRGVRSAGASAPPPASPCRPRTSPPSSARPARFAEAELAPRSREADRHGARFENGRITLPPHYATAWRRWVEGGWRRWPPRSRMAARACRAQPVGGGARTRHRRRRGLHPLPCAGCRGGRSAAPSRQPRPGGALPAPPGLGRMGRDDVPDRTAGGVGSLRPAHPRRTRRGGRLAAHRAGRSTSPGASTISPTTSCISCWPGCPMRRPARAASACSPRRSAWPTGGRTPSAAPASSTSLASTPPPPAVMLFEGAEAELVGEHAPRLCRRWPAMMNAARLAVGQQGVARDGAGPVAGRALCRTARTGWPAHRPPCRCGAHAGGDARHRARAGRLICLSAYHAMDRADTLGDAAAHRCGWRC